MIRQAADDLLGAEPAILTGALVGYARVSAEDQRLDRQTLALKAAGRIRIFADKKSGKDAEREELAKALDYLRLGDTLVVPSLDRLARSLEDLITSVADLRRRGVGFRSLKEALDTTTPGGRPPRLPRRCRWPAWSSGTGIVAAMPRRRR
ncbi:recombinase family protein [Spirillospora sp. NPDC049024]